MTLIGSDQILLIRDFIGEGRGKLLKCLLRSSMYAYEWFVELCLALTNIAVRAFVMRKDTDKYAINSTSYYQFKALFILFLFIFK